MKKIVGRLPKGFRQPDKYKEEEEFWINEISNLILWYNGNIKEHYQTASPTNDQKIQCHTIEHSAILTWFELHQKPKYAVDLQLPLDVFRGMKLLDVGSGPMPSAEVFEDCKLYCLDPLIPNYIRAGYPLHYYRENTRFVYAYAENMPFKNDFFDAVIAVNAIDHVDDIYLTAKEIGRVLKPNGMLRMHMHYHKKTTIEPLALNDDIILKAFSWCDGFNKISELMQKKGSVAGAGESFVLWSNF